MEKIVDRLASGETLVDIAKDKNMPSYRAVTRAVAASEESLGAVPERAHSAS